MLKSQLPDGVQLSTQAPQSQHHTEIFHLNRTAHMDSTLSRRFREARDIAGDGVDGYLRRVESVAIERLPSHLKENNEAVRQEIAKIQGMMAADNMTWEGFCIGMLIKGYKQVKLTWK